MLNRRIIPTLLLRDTGFVKTKQFGNPVYLGDAVNTVRLFNEKMVDEVIVLDIDASKQGRGPNFEMLEKLASQCFMPMAYGGGVSNLKQAARLFRMGIEKVVLNSAALEQGRLIKEIAEVYGSQAVVVAIDILRDGENLIVRYPVGGNPSSQSPLDHALWAQAQGAGEILIQDVERDGTKKGYDIGLFKIFADSLNVPLIALGGASDDDDLLRVLEEGHASAAAAGSLFVFAGRKNAVLISTPEFADEDDWTPISMSDQSTDTVDPPKQLLRPNRPMCNLTVLDDTDPDFAVDENGISLLALKGLEKLKRERVTGEAGRKRIQAIADRAKAEGKGKEYDCVIGLSGGVDSTYVAMMVKELGLRPLALHLDNGWNSNTAVLNIKRIVDRLGIDLYTYVINWEDVQDLQRAFLRASVPDVEVITDHAVLASTFQIADQYNIKTVIFGINVATESILPEAWHYTKRDAEHIRAIHRKYGERKLTNFPFIEPWDFERYKRVKGIHYESLLSYIDFNKAEALKELREKINYEPYPRKHGESKFTQFFQEYFLPEKFGFDKRKAHFSNLIISEQMSRDEALCELQKPLYVDPRQKARDLEYIRRKLGFSAEEWEEIMKAPPALHDDFPGYYTRLKQFRRLKQALLSPFRKL